MNVNGRVAIAGGTGFPGRSLARHPVEPGYGEVAVSRHASRVPDLRRHATRDARTVGDRAPRFDGATPLHDLFGPRAEPCGA